MSPRESGGCRRTRGEAEIATFTRLIFAAYFLEAGLILIVAPWSAFWDRNAFARTEAIASVLSSPLIRGAVSGVGLITAVAGFAELVGVFVRRQPRDAAPPAEGP